MLIDDLMERDESIEIVKLDDPHFVWDSGPVLTMPNGFIKPIDPRAFDEFLNLLKIPTKYMGRCTDYFPDLAQDNVNYWLRNSDLSVLVEKDIITQIFDGKRSYLPSYLLNDHIIEHLGPETKIIHSKTNGDFFTATYLVKNLGVKILFSDCFTINLRIDGAFWWENSLWIMPVRDRKFRAADKDLGSLLAQVDEFCDLALEGIKRDLLPAFSRELPREPSWIYLLGFELRLNRKTVNELNSIITNGNESVLTLSHKILEKLFLEEVDIDMETTRNIQVAITNYIINGCFK